MNRRISRCLRSARDVFPAVALVIAMGFGIAQASASATDQPGRERRGFCDDVLPCQSVCGDAGGTWFGLLPDGRPLCDCCAP